MIALDFEAPSANEGAEGPCTRHSVSTYALAATGMPLRALPAGDYPLALNPVNPKSKPRFIQATSAGAQLAP